MKLFFFILRIFINIFEDFEDFEDYYNKSKLIINNISV